jgi:hypothetical protein
MGAISVRDDNDIWGAASRFVYSMLEFCISETGDREYLRKFKESFDFGYNSFEIYELNDQDHTEFLSLIKKYMDENAYINLNFPEEEVRNALQDLIDRMEIAESERSQQRGRN